MACVPFSRADQVDLEVGGKIKVGNTTVTCEQNTVPTDSFKIFCRCNQIYNDFGGSGKYKGQIIKRNINTGNDTVLRETRGICQFWNDSDLIYGYCDKAACLKDLRTMPECPQVEN